MDIKSGYAEINGARLYYEMAGSGTAFIMIHAGIADCRMWDHEFEAFASSHLVMRFDMRGYGKSLPVEGEFNIQGRLGGAAGEVGDSRASDFDGMFYGGRTRD